MQYRLLGSVVLTVALVSACAGLGNNLSQSEVVEQTYDSGLHSIVWENRNSYSRNEASVALLVKAGSLHEKPDQLGFAHFVEHMGFNSTRDFPNASVVDRLQSLGVQLGTHANAYTTYDHTLYYLQFNDVTDEKMSQAIEIMAQWARFQNFEAASVAAEIPVVVEEWRLHQSKELGAYEQFEEHLYRGSRYANRHPVGTQTSIQSATSDNLRDFYQAWYQPANSSIIVTGDISADYTQELIQQYFGAWENTQPPATQVWQANYKSLPDQMLLLDDRLTEQQLKLSWLVQQPWPTSAEEEMVHLSWQAGLDILNARFDKRLLAFEGRISNFNAHYHRVDQHQITVHMTAGIGHDVYAEAAEALAEERWRMINFGVSQSELAQWKLSKINNEKSQQDSASHLLDLAIYHELYDGRLEGQGEYFEAMQLALNRLQPEQVKNAFSLLVTDPPQFIISQNKRQTKPDITALITAYTAVNSAPELPKAKVNSNQSDAPVGDIWRIQSSVNNDLIETQKLAHDVTQWRFSNGLVMLHKYSDSAPGKAYLEVAGLGGYNRLDAQQSITARMAIYSMAMSGLRSLDGAELEHWIESKGMALQPWLDFSSRGLSANGPVDAMETWLKLSFVAMTEGRYTDTAWTYALNQSRQYITSYSQHPHRNLGDLVEQRLYLNDAAIRTLTLPEIESVEPSHMYRMYKHYFSGVQNYHGAIVGDVSAEAALSMVKKTLARLPKMPLQIALSQQRPYPTAKRSFTEKIQGSGEESARIMRRYIVSKEKMSNHAAVDSVAYLEHWVGSALTHKLREELGLTYSVSTAIQGLTLDYDDYELLIDLQVAPANIDKTKLQLDQLLAQLGLQLPAQNKLYEWKKIQREGFDQYVSSAQSQAKLLSSFGLYPVVSAADMIDVDEATGAPLVQEMGAALAQFIAPTAVTTEIVWLP